MVQNFSLLVSQNVRAEMARRGVAQTSLGAEIELSQAAVSKRLLGITPWTVDELMAVAAYLDTNISVLLGQKLSA